LPESAVNNLYEAKYIADYLEEYLDNHVYHGKTLRSRICFGFYVTKVGKADDGFWEVFGTAKNGSQTIRAKKLIVASGTTSIPNIPEFQNDGYTGQIIHIKQFASSGILADSPKHVCVLGAGKSAADMAYESAKAGHAVSWIIRATGTGPGIFVLPKPIGSFKNPGEIAMTRIAGTISPSFLMKDTWWARFLHCTRIGRWIVGKIFATVENDSFKFAGFDGPSKEVNGFGKLKPTGR
jgi:dimethylaniline monooxygenase (N-oxide forming)